MIHINNVYKNKTKGFPIQTVILFINNNKLLITINNIKFI